MPVSPPSPNPVPRSAPVAPDAPTLEDIVFLGTPEYKKHATTAIQMTAASALIAGVMAGAILTSKVIGIDLGLLLKGDTPFYVLGAVNGVMLLSGGVAYQQGVDKKDVLEAMLTYSLLGLGIGMMLGTGDKVLAPALMIPSVLILPSIVYTTRTPYAQYIAVLPKSHRQKVGHLKIEAIANNFLSRLVPSLSPLFKDRKEFLLAKRASIIEARLFDPTHLINPSINLPSPFRLFSEPQLVTEKIRQIGKNELFVHDYQTLRNGTCFGDAVDMLVKLDEGMNIETITSEHLDGASIESQSYQLLQTQMILFPIKEVLEERLSSHEVTIESALGKIEPLLPEGTVLQIEDPMNRLIVYREVIMGKGIGIPDELKFILERFQLDDIPKEEIFKLLDLNSKKIVNNDKNLEERLKSLAPGKYFIAASHLDPKNLSHAMVFVNDGHGNRYFFNPGVGTYKYQEDEDWTAIKKTEALNKFTSDNDASYDIYQMGNS